MNCPKCGLQPLPDQKFCRSCGDNLQAITQPLAAHSGVFRLDSTSSITVQDETQRWNRLSFWGFIIMFIGVAVGIIGKMILHEEMVTVVGVLISLVGMFLTVYPYLLPSPRRKSDPPPTSHQEILTQSQPTTYLPQESNIEYVPSITERTTDLLKNSPVTSQRRKEGE